ncbi:hypothetical protein PJN92_29715, partial [Mycobacterium kansasii]
LNAVAEFFIDSARLYRKNLQQAGIFVREPEESLTETLRNLIRQRQIAGSYKAHQFVWRDHCN